MVRRVRANGQVIDTLSFQLSSMYDSIEDGEVRETLIEQLATNDTRVAQDKLVGSQRTIRWFRTAAARYKALGKSAIRGRRNHANW